MDSAADPAFDIWGPAFAKNDLIEVIFEIACIKLVN